MPEIPNTHSKEQHPEQKEQTNTKKELDSLFGDVVGNIMNGKGPDWGKLFGDVVQYFISKSGLPFSLPKTNSAPTPESKEAEYNKVSTEKLIKEAGDYIKGFEGFHSKAYSDYQQYSIGYGTKASGPNQTITREDAQRELENKLHNEFLPGVQRIPYWNEMNQNMQKALLSFAYNVGADFYGHKNAQTLSSYLKNKEWDKVGKQMEQYNKAGGKVLQGLVARRKSEAATWNKGLEEVS